MTQATKCFNVELPMPVNDGVYTVKVLFADVAQSNTASLQVYGIPTFSSFNIPNAGTEAEGDVLSATVSGKNFIAPGVAASDFTVSCGTNSIVNGSAITVVNDTNLTVTLDIPENAGFYDVTISNGKNTITSTFTVKDTKNYAVGDIILIDGSKIGVADIESYTINENNKPVAVVAGFNANGVVLGLGLKKSSGLRWAPSSTTGYNTKFTDIIVEYSGSTSSGYTFTGVCDGSNNWEEICKVDKDGTDTAEEIAENYPAFNFALNYGTNQGYTGDLASGWYIPSISELYEIYKNKETLQTSLSKVSGFTIGTDWYWSSSQSSSHYKYACGLDFSYGYVLNYYKDNDYIVLVVHQF